MIREVGFLLRRPNPEIQAYIETVDKTLDMVFGVPDGRRAELVSYLKGKHSKGYWDVTLHYLPLYSAAGLAEVKIEYPDFDKYEKLYAQRIRREEAGRCFSDRR